MSLHGYAQDIVITIPKPKEEPKPEEKKKEEKPELPKPAQLSVTGINTTDFEFVISVKGVVVGKPNSGVVAQQEIGKMSTLTFVSFFDTNPDSEFSLKEYEVILKVPGKDEDDPGFTQGLSCEVKGKKAEEKEDEEGEDEKEEGKEKGADAAPAAAGDEINIVKKTINFLFFKPEEQKFPLCRINLDS